MYTYQTKVPYSKVDRTGKCSFYEVVNYMQDATTFQSESLGVGMEYTLGRNRGWILVANRIELYKPIKLCQNITVGTAPTEFQIFGGRQYFIKDENEEYLAKSEAMWLLIDIESRRPVRPEAEDIDAYEVEQLFEPLNVSRKIKLTGDRQAATPFTVLKTYIDSNGHMNNVDYLRAAAEFVPEDFEVKTIEIVYLKEAMEGQVINPYIYKEETGLGLVFEDQEGQILTKIKFN